MSMIQVKTGSGNKGLDWVFILGALAAYPKTADLLSLFSPKILDEIFGMNMSLPYGGFCAFLVEGVILFLHFDRRAYLVQSAQVVKWLMFGISFLCQVFDGQVTTNAIAQMSDTLKLVLTYGIPALPLIIAALVAMIGPLPDVTSEQEKVVVRKPRVGLKNHLYNFWYGDRQENTGVSVKIGEPKFIPSPEPEPEPQSSGNGSNPTNRQS